MPWVNAVVGKIASGVSSVEWKVYVVRSAGEVRRRDLQRADFDSRQRVFKMLRRNRELEEIADHPLPRVLGTSNAFALGPVTKRLTRNLSGARGRSIQEQNSGAGQSLSLT
jgi:hypothetical protein